jgi:hypothetical protein
MDMSQAKKVVSGIGSASGIACLTSAAAGIVTGNPAILAAAASFGAASAAATLATGESRDGRSSRASNTREHAS